MKITYPDWLEKWWVEYACAQLSCSEVSEKSAYLEKQVQKLSDLFTLERSTAADQDYYSRHDLLLGYGLFYFPQTFIRTQFPLREMMARGWSPAPERVRVLDLAAGFGAASISAATLFKQDQLSTPPERIEICAVDRSAGSLRVLEKITSQLSCRWPNTSWNTVMSSIQTPLKIRELTSHKWDLILLSFALNELFETRPVDELLPWVSSLMRLLAPGGLLLITEPALQKTSRTLQVLRDAIAADGRNYIWGPCLHYNRCPLLRDERFWCHEVRRWQPPESMNVLNRHLHRQIDVLKFSYLCLSNSSPASVGTDPGVFRLVSPVSRQKGRLLFSGCSADGEVHQFDLLSRTNSNDVFKKWERGDILVTDELRPLRKGAYRIVDPLGARRKYEQF